ncbi:MAG: aminotransferase class I/II-fold pyridoxal phosphate-dependent enzyme [Bacteriovoracaceae bacterium]
MLISASHKLNDISEYYFSRKLEQIKTMNSEGKKVINLGIGSPDLTPSFSTIEAMKKALETSSNHGYSTHRALPELRNAIINWYEKTYAVKINDINEILPLLGSKEGIFYIANAFLNENDIALVPNPGYPTYAISTKLAGAKVKYYDLVEKNGWYPDFNALSNMDLTNVKIMWVNYPNMPTGAVATANLLQDLVEFGAKHKILICHDNPYSMILNKNRPLSILQFDPKMEYSLELNSFSKNFNMAGWRIGILVAEKEIVNTVLKVKSNVDSGMFLPLQWGAIAATKNSDEWHKQRNGVYAERREWIYKIFDKLNLIYPKYEQEGLFVWARVPDSIENVESFIDNLLEKSHVFFAPGFIFGSNGERYIRSSLCQPVEIIKEALLRIGNS